MPWAAGSYTKGNAGTGGWTGDASLGIGIEAGRHDTQDNDFATGINQCLNKDGSNSMTADLNAGGFRVANVNAGTAAVPAICAANDVDTGIFSPAADTWAVATNGSERLRISSTGNVGIGGTTLPTRFLIAGVGQTGGITDAGDKSAAIRVAASGGSANDGGQIEFGFGYGSYAQSYFAAIKGLGQSGTSNTVGDLAVYTRNATGDSSLTERMRITGGGKILLHCTTSSNTAGEAYFSSVPATEPPYLTFAKTYSGPRNVILNFHNGTYIGGVDMDNVSTSFPTSSDYRLKENVVEIANSLQRLKTLRPVRFNFISEPSQTIDGFLAHEVKEVVPNAVSGEKDEIHEDGSIKVQALDHSKLVPLLTAALKELNTKVEALEARIEALEA